LEIQELLGRGGMGAVYKARQTKLDRLVALKIIRPESTEDPTFAARFSREARTLAHLNHPNIVTVYDFGEVILRDARAEDVVPPTLYYFLMEYVDGANLRQLMQGKDLQFGPALTIIQQICEALQYAHDEGVVHRDIKPENILVDTKGQIKIADFGLARLVTSSEQHVTLTGTDQVMGTPRYMAPEQMAGSHSVDHRADIYSLGVVFYEMLTGEVPMGQFEPPSKKTAVDGRLDEVVLRALAREPERRFQQANEFKSSVEEISSSPNVPRPPVVSIGAERQAQNRWQRIAGGLGRAVKQRSAIADVLMIMMCLAGAFMIALPWLDIEVVEPGNARWAPRTSTIAGYQIWSGIATAAGFVGLALLLITTPIKHRLRVWWPSVTTGVAAITLLLTLLVRVQIESSTFGFIAWEADSPLLEFRDLPLQELEHRITHRVGFYGALGLSATLLLAGAIGIRRAVSQRGGSRDNAKSTDPPLATFRFTVAADRDIGSRVVFHFSGLGYRLVDEQPNAWVFRRGNKLGGLWTTDIRAYHTTLTVVTSPGRKDELLVSCVWAVRTGSAWGTGNDIRLLKGEGHELESLLSGGHDDKWADTGNSFASIHNEKEGTFRTTSRSPLPEAPSAGREYPVKSASGRSPVSSLGEEVQLAELRAAVAKPALGLIGVGSLSILTQIALFFRLFWWWIEFHGVLVPNFIGWLVLDVMVVVLAATVWMIYGAISMLTLGSLRDAQASAIAALLPLPGFLIGLPFGIWALAVLSRPEVCDRFRLQTVDRSLWEKAGLSLLLVLTLLFFCALVIST
jgi:tRNA A-37 threonylcarbamoyl transferase component Bud32